LVGGVTAANVASGATAANSATADNTANTLIKRDASGNFTAGTISANLVGDVTGNVTGAASLNVLKSGDTMTGPLILSRDPLSTLEATTKQYVDARSGVTSFNTRTGAITLESGDVTTALGFTPVNNALSSAQIYVGNASGVAAGVALSGDATLSNTGALTLANSGVAAGTYQSVTVDGKGRVTAGTNPTTLAGYGITDAVNKALTSGQIFVGNASNVATGVALNGDATISNTGALTLANSGAAAGTYKSVTVDAKGRVTSGTNPTTLSGYGITDAVSKAGDTMTGLLVLSGDPTANLGAATKQYVDTKFNGGVTSFNTRTGAVTLSASDVTTALNYTPVNRAGDSMTGALILNADPTAA
ncbi:MAG: hypothetical protein EBZ48_17655, partial [Proteobacteria bacterium]|nr:hypothetical protein [Pseudomonadota bacterium]